MGVIMSNMSEDTKLLFLCSGNTCRSPSFEQYFRDNKPEYEVYSSGTWHGYPYKLTHKLLEYVDRVFVMDLEQERHIREKFPEYMDKVELVGISDQYAYMEERLVHLIQYWVEKKGL